MWGRRVGGWVEQLPECGALEGWGNGGVARSQVVDRGKVG